MRFLKSKIILKQENTDNEPQSNPATLESDPKIKYIEEGQAGEGFIIKKEESGQSDQQQVVTERRRRRK